MGGSQETWSDWLRLKRIKGEAAVAAAAAATAQRTRVLRPALAH
ncbi:hypothetical protein [Streptomyces sp. 1222.5]